VRWRPPVPVPPAARGEGRRRGGEEGQAVERDGARCRVEARPSGSRRWHARYESGTFVTVELCGDLHCATGVIRSGHAPERHC